MALEIHQKLSQDLRMTQELVMTPQLQQAIKLLQLTRMELLDRVQEELEENPLLEEVKEEEEPSAAAQETAREAEGAVDTPASEELPVIDWEQYFSHYDTPPPSDRPIEIEEERPSLESVLAPEISLQDHLLWQLRMSDIGEEGQKIGALVIGNVDDDGYLRATAEEIAQAAETTPEAVEAVLLEIQRFDPTGVASRDLRECLLRQAEEAEAPEPVLRVIDKGLKQLETKNYKQLARELGLEFEEVVEAARAVASFDPRPGRLFSSSRVDYIVPDVFVTREGDGYAVHLNDEGIPRLRVSPYYRAILQSTTVEGKAAKGYIQERMQAALWLIRSIQQRQQTLLKVAQSLVHFQRDFLDHGVTRLKPLILKDVARDIEMHESTVSRVTTGKYIHTPQGTFELKYFFSSAIQRDVGEDMAATAAKARIREVVAHENPKKPLSDQQIAGILGRDFSMRIARRTVTKYRESMGILSSSSRRSYF